MKKCFGFIAGPSGIGKGYGVGDVFTEYFGARIFVTGEWCREHYMSHASSGNLAPDDALIEAIEADYRIHKPHRFLIDAPRTLNQVRTLIGVFNKWDKNATIVTAHITANNEVCRDRIRHRAIVQMRTDDAKDSIINGRLNVYFGKGGIREKVIPFLKEKTVYRFIDGHLSLELVRDEVRDVIGPALFGT